MPKITELTSLTTVTSDDIFPVVNDPSGTPATQKVTLANLKTSLAMVKGDVGLGNVDNTSDTNKPVSTATQTALDGKSATSHNHAGVYAPVLGSDDNYVTDAEKTAIGALKGYTLSVQALTSSPADGQTVYFGQLPKAPTTTAAISRVYIRKAGTIKMANIFCYSGTAGTNESWSVYVRLNNTTDTLIEAVAAATNERTFDNSSLSISVAAGDYIEIKSVQPTWATNPLTTIWGGYLYIE